MKCRICGSDKTSIYGKFSFIDVIKCHKCQVMFAASFPSPKRINAIYSEDYYRAWKANSRKIPESVGEMKKGTFGSYFRLLSKFVSLNNKKLLDVGCATGFLLDEAKKQGSDCWGVELNPYGVRESSKKFPKKIFRGTIEEAKYKSNFFDIVTLIDLIEHTQDPVGAMKEVWRITKKGGYVVLVTPNVGGLWAKALGKRWTNFKEEHLYYFNEASLRRLVKNLGFNFVVGKAATKTLTLRYIMSQLETFQTPVLSPFVKIFKIFPSFLLDIPFPIRTGDYLVILTK